LQKKAFGIRIDFITRTFQVHREREYKKWIFNAFTAKQNSKPAKNVTEKFAVVQIAEKILKSLQLPKYNAPCAAEQSLKQTRHANIAEALFLTANKDFRIQNAELKNFTGNLEPLAAK
jgi:ABC-type branched-subunit amino acid transport system ATPase component